MFVRLAGVVENSRSGHLIRRPKVTRKTVVRKTRYHAVVHIGRCAPVTFSLVDIRDLGGDKIIPRVRLLEIARKFVESCGSLKAS